MLILLLATCAACTMYGGKKRHGWSGATGGEDLERQFWADVKSKNFTELEKHMAVSWVYLSSAGPLDRAATLERMRQTPVFDYSLGDFKVTPNGPDMVVTYTALVQGENGTSAKPVRMMTVWQRVEKGWMAIAHAEIL